MDASPPARLDGSSSARSTLIHRELVQLAILIAAALAGFLITRVIAASNREMSLRDAAEWYQRGERQLEAGDTSAAIESFRRATLKNRHDKQYVLALARALARLGQTETARTALLALRESAPEDREVNLQLARLAADRQDLTEATRYYHNALYAPWPVEGAAARRDVRIEFVRVLLEHQQSNRAVAELVALSTDLPDDAAVHVRVGELFAAAGDSPRAREQFQRALRVVPDNGPALAGAGQAAFHMGDYLAARSFLRRAPADLPGVAETHEVAELVLSNDPLAFRIGVAARRQRLMDDLAYADQRLGACLDRSSGEPEGDAQSLRRTVQDFAAQVKRSKALEADTIETGLDVIGRVGQYVSRRCAPPTPRDRALMLIPRLHGVDPR